MNLELLSDKFQKLGFAFLRVADDEVIAGSQVSKIQRDICLARIHLVLEPHYYPALGIYHIPYDLHASS